MGRIYLSPPDMSIEARERLLQAFDSNWIAPLGPHVDAFEQELAAYVGTADAAALSSGTAGLHLALVLLGVGPGDDVIVSDLTFAASANVVRYVGARPVFVDSDSATWTLDPDLLSEALDDCARRGKLPKAVIAVDLYGQCADYDRLSASCAKYEVPIIQDASESLGAQYRGKPAGAQGVIGVFSFNGNKIITTSGGGMLVSDRKDFVARARHLASQAREPQAYYQHVELGYNYRLSNLLAAIGSAQLRHLDGYVDQRRSVFEDYKRALGTTPGWHFMPEPTYARSTRWLTCALVDRNESYNRDTLLQSLARADIEARPLWKPMHLQPLYEGCPCYGGSVSERLFESGICLPSGSSLTKQDLARVLGVLRGAVFQRNGAQPEPS